MTPASQSKTIPRPLGIFLWFFIMSGLCLLCLGVWNLMGSVRCESWPTVPGVILAAKMESHDNGENGTTYSANLGYDYVVAGTHYDGTRVAIAAMSASPAYAQTILNLMSAIGEVVKA